MRSIANNILSAIDIVVDKKISEAQYDRTIIATVIKILDEVAQKYSVQYQDNIFEAYASNNTIYNVGDNVYVLIPINDNSNDKHIIGAVSSMRKYNQLIDSVLTNYTIIGQSIVNKQDSNEAICALQNNTEVLWQNSSLGRAIIKQIEIDESAFLTYMRDSDALIVSAEFLTILPMYLIQKGNYGLELEIEYANNIIKTYRFDSNDMTSNPYSLFSYSKQFKIFDNINGAEFVKLRKIQFFSEGFNLSELNNQAKIHIKNLEIFAANKKSNFVSNNIAVNILAPNGTAFDGVKTSLSIEARVEKNNNTITDSTINYYWFKENANIFAGSEKYLNYGGIGWEYISNNKVLYLTESETQAYSTKYKVVALYQNALYNKETIVYNLNDNIYRLTIAQHKNDNKIDLICNIYPQPEGEVAYKWTETDIYGWTEQRGGNQSVYTIDNISLIVQQSIFKCAIKINNLDIGTTSIVILNDNSVLALKNLEIYYALGDSNIQPPLDGWTEMAPVYIENKFLWQKVIKTFTDDSKVENISCLVGVQGKGIEEIQQFYLATNIDNVNNLPPLDSWETNPALAQISEQLPFLWSYILITYTDNTAWRQDPTLIGTYGKKGKDAQTVIKSINYYAISNEPTVPKDIPYLVNNATEIINPNTYWTNDLAILIDQGKFLWKKEFLEYDIYTDGRPKYLEQEPVVIGYLGKDGLPGEPGVPGINIISIVQQYAYLDPDNFPSLEILNSANPEDPNNPGFPLWYTVEDTETLVLVVENVNETIDENTIIVSANNSESEGGLILQNIEAASVYPIKKGYLRYRREKYIYADGSVQYSKATLSETDLRVTEWCAAENTYYIDGRKIYSNSISKNALSEEINADFESFKETQFEWNNFQNTLDNDVWILDGGSSIENI